jgi:uncharacterized RDD family membrane protein YckC
MSARSARYFEVYTPEGISFSLELAGPVARLLAWSIDLGCKGVILSILSTVAPALGMFSGDFATSAMILMAFFVTQGYQITLEYLWRGQTVGKRIMGLRVADEQGLRLKFSQVALRNLLRIMDQLPALYLVGGMAMVLNPSAQRLGDFAANTIVIRTRKGTPYRLTDVGQAKYNSLRAWPHLEARLRQRVSPDVALIAIQALQRRESLDPDARIEVMRDIAQHLREVVKFPEEATTGVTDEQYVRNVLDSLFRQSGNPAAKPVTQ